MGRKIVEEIPEGITKFYKSHVPTLEVIEVTVNAIHFHKGDGSWQDRDKYSIELLDPDGNVLPRMVCERVPDGEGYLIKNNLHITEAEAYKRVAKNVHQVLQKTNPGIEEVDDEVIQHTLEILKDKYPHYLI
jgi:hypothetical protein